MAKLSIGKETIFVDLFMIPYISNIGVLIVLFGLFTLAIALFVDFTLIPIALLTLLAGFLLTFVPRYVLFDYSKGIVRKYYNWGIIKIGERISLDLFNRIEIIRQDRTYTRNSRFSSKTTRNITYEVFLGVELTTERFEIKEFIKHSEARVFALEYADKLGLKLVDKAAEVELMQNSLRNKRGRRRRR